jgi:hypothetical protein
MPLVAGTALQNGHYVVDALLEDAANGPLYWGTHIATGMRVYLQQLTPAIAELDGAVQQCLQALAFAPQPPLPQPLQTFVDGEYRYLAMGTSLGQPWSLLARRQSPATPKAALARVRATAQAVTALLDQGLPTVDLSPNRIWLAATDEEDPVVTLTGLTVASPDVAPSLAHPIRGLAALLHSSLAGHLMDAADLAAWGPALRQQRPDLSPLILEAIRIGLQTDIGNEQDLRQAIADWLQTLPDAEAILTVPVPAATVSLAVEQPADTAILSPEETPRVETSEDGPEDASPADTSPEAAVPETAVPETVSPAPALATATEAGTDAAAIDPSPTLSDTVEPLPNPVPAGALATTKAAPLAPAPPQQRPQRSSGRRLFPALVVTGLVAAIAGVGAGAAWRLAPNGLPGQLRLDPNQSFPPQSDWSGDRPDAGFDRPYLPEGDLERPPIPEPAWDPATLPADDPWAIDDPWEPTAIPDPWEPEFADPTPAPVTRPTPADAPAPSRAPAAGSPGTPAPAPQPNSAGRAPTPPPAAPAPAEPAPASEETAPDAATES